MALSIRAWAKQVGVRESAVRKWVSRGMPVLPDGKIEPDKAWAWYEKNVGKGRATNPMTGEKREPNPPPDPEEVTSGTIEQATRGELTTAEALRAKENLNVARLAQDIARKAGRLAKVDEYETVMLRLVSGIVAELSALPQVAATEAAALGGITQTQQVAIVQAVERAVDRVRAQIAKGQFLEPRA